MVGHTGGCATAFGCSFPQVALPRWPKATRSPWLLGLVHGQERQRLSSCPPSVRGLSATDPGGKGKTVHLSAANCPL